MEQGWVVSALHHVVGFKLTEIETDEEPVDPKGIMQMSRERRDGMGGIGGEGRFCVYCRTGQR
jgi:hypothetical protein